MLYSVTVPYTPDFKVEQIRNYPEWIILGIMSSVIALLESLWSNCVKVSLS